jgi:thioredoxin reductase (NADPH)
MDNYDVVIVGGGPAGISAALYAKRSNLNVLVLYYGESNLEKAHKIDNYYGFPEGITGLDLFNNGITQAKNLGVTVKQEEVLDISRVTMTDYKVKTSEGEYESKVVILATGSKKVTPNIKGAVEFEGKGVSYCAICDGFFYKNKDLVVIGNGDYAISEADELKGIASSVRILTDGLDAPENSKDYEVITKKITEIAGENKVSKIIFEDNTSIEVAGVFVALGRAGGADFAKKLGVLTEGDSITVNENMKTSVDGIYSCGDAVGGLLQVSKSVSDGAKAGIDAATYIRSLKSE